MTAQERTKELIKSGAAVQVYTTEGTHTEVLAAVRWAAGVVRWCGVWPEDHHHVHDVPYATAKLAAGGRDVAVYAASGAMVLYICPIDESNMNTDKAVASFGKWQHHLTRFNNQEKFDRFFNEDEE